MVEKAKILEAVKTALEKAPKRKFSESIDITINLKNIDMAQPKNRGRAISSPRQRMRKLT